MPKIPFDVDRDFGRARRVAPKSSTAPGNMFAVLFAIGATALAYALLRSSGLI